jgi:dTMP kinase
MEPCKSMLQPKPYDGFFITLEGGDGCGKTTLATYLTAQLQSKGFTVFKTREPGGPPRGGPPQRGLSLAEQIRKLLLDPSNGAILPQAELLLYLAARSQHYEMAIKPALHCGAIVICERFHDSTIAYQGSARHLGISYVENLCTLICPHPDLTLLLDLDPALGLQRVRSGRELDRLEQEKLPFHQEVRQGYLHLADAYPNRITLIDAAQSTDQVAHLAWEVIVPHLKVKTQNSGYDETWTR